MLYTYDKNKNIYASFVLLFSWPRVREVCTNYEVVMLQPQTGTPPDLGFVANCDVDIPLIPTPPFMPATQCTLEGYP